MLGGAIECDDITHCSDSRTLLSGLELGLSIDVTGQPPAAISVVTDNPDLLQLDGFTTEADVCRDGTNTRVEGRLRFEGVGEASLIVMNGREEIDRFTWRVDEAASLSVQAELLDPERVVDLGSIGGAAPSKPSVSSIFLKRDAPGELDVEVALGDLTQSVHVTVTAPSSN